jgi:hypothetical protein
MVKAIKMEGGARGGADGNGLMDGSMGGEVIICWVGEEHANPPCETGEQSHQRGITKSQPEIMLFSVHLCISVQVTMGVTVPSILPRDRV